MYFSLPHDFTLKTVDGVPGLLLKAKNTNHLLDKPGQQVIVDVFWPEGGHV